MSQILLLLPMVFINPIEINIFIPSDLQKRNISVKNLRGVQKILKLCKVINQLLQREKTTPELPSVFLDGENSLNNPFDIAQKFN